MQTVAKSKVGICTGKTSSQLIDRLEGAFPGGVECLLPTLTACLLQRSNSSCRSISSPLTRGQDPVDDILYKRYFFSAYASNARLHYDVLKIAIDLLLPHDKPAPELAQQSGLHDNQHASFRPQYERDRRR